MNVLTAAQPAMRQLSSIGLAGVVTMALFLLMQSLINVDTPALEASVPFRANPWMDPPKEPDVIRDDPVEKPQQPEPIPEWNSPQETLIDHSDTLLIGQNFIPETGVKDIDPSAGTSTIVPVFRIAPDYPASALRRGIEGHVDLIFDVSVSGKTTNIRVLEAQPEGVFERAAIRTLEKWKYKPPMDDGVPYSQKNMTTRISFRLEV